MSETFTIDEYRERAKSFLDANAKVRAEETFEWGEGDDSVSLFTENDPERDAADLAAATSWANKRFDAGFGWITGPTEYGGQGLSRDHERAYYEIEADYDTPSQAVFGIGLGMVAPTILAHATEEVRRAYLVPMYRGDVVGCQLFSEPGSGSDLASVSTRAVRDGDEWILNGQKVWTSYAHQADIGEIVTRSDPDAPKHRGLTAFVVDMHAPGVEVRPLRQMTGGSSFNEVFFTDVRVPDTHRLGDVNGGWTVALTTLMNERASIGGGGGSVGAMSSERLVQLVRNLGMNNDPLIRQQLAQVLIANKVATYTNMRAMAKVAAGQLPGPEMSIAKLALTNNLQLLAQFLTGTLGPEMVANSGRWGTYAWGELVVGLPGLRVAGGTDEVMRNIVGERVLGLPKEPVAAS